MSLTANNFDEMHQSQTQFLPNNGFIENNNRSGKMTGNGGKRKKKQSPILNTSNSQQATLPMFQGGLPISNGDVSSYQ